tara:strand:+ start:12793 stop:12939 length:147 start_codon:yes stop_codon:yes gene_type:complete
MRSDLIKGEFIQLFTALVKHFLNLCARGATASATAFVTQLVKPFLHFV